MNSDYIFIFEDKKTMAASLLLTEHSYNRNSIIFTDGNGRLYSTLHDNYNTHSTFIVYLDYNPLNTELENFYKKFKNKVRNLPSYSDNVAIIPILCFEHLLLKMLTFYHYVNNEDLLKVSTQFDAKFVFNKSSGSSIEAALKYALKHYTDEYYHNVNMKHNDKINSGRFYSEGNVDVKAEQLYTMFPVSLILSDIHRNFLHVNKVSYVPGDVQSAIVKTNDFYKKVFEDLGFKRRATDLALVVKKR